MDLRCRKFDGLLAATSTSWSWHWADVNNGLLEVHIARLWKWNILIAVSLCNNSLGLSQLHRLFELWLILSCLNVLIFIQWLIWHRLNNLINWLISRCETKVTCWIIWWKRCINWHGSWTRLEEIECSITWIYIRTLIVIIWSLQMLDGLSMCLNQITFLFFLLFWLFIILVSLFTVLFDFYLLLIYHFLLGFAFNTEIITLEFVEVGLVQLFFLLHYLFLQSANFSFVAFCLQFFFDFCFEHISFVL